MSTRLKKNVWVIGLVLVVIVAVQFGSQESKASTWTPQTSLGSRDWSGVAASYTGVKFAAVSGNSTDYVYTYTDGVWTQQQSSGPRNWKDIASSHDGIKLAAVAYNDYIHTSIDSGATWTQQTNSAQKEWSDITSSDSGNFLAAISASEDFIYTSSDGGGSWTQQTNSGQHVWSDVVVSHDGTKLAATSLAGSVYTSTDSGITWTEQTGLPAQAWNSIASSGDGTKLVVVAQGVNIYTSADSGVTWVEQTNSGQQAWTAVASSDDGSRIVATVVNSYISTSLDGGETWIQQTGSGSGAWYSVAVSGDGSKLIAGEGGGIAAGFVHLATLDITPPLISAGLPSGVQADGTIQVTLQVSTDVSATCKYGGTASTNYALIAHTFGVTGGTTHTQIVNVSENTSYTYYVRCAGLDGAATQSDYIIEFETGEDTVAPVVSSITSVSANDTYSVGDSVNVSITFSEPVTSTGDVLITLETGVVDGTCATPISNNTTLSCSFVVQPGYVTNDLNVKSVSGTIIDAAGNPVVDFTPDSNIADTKNIILAALTPAWTPQTGSGGLGWWDIASSADGTKLAATTLGGSIYMSTDSGVTWTTYGNASGSRQWRGITSSADGTKLAAVVSSGYVYTSIDSGVTWTTQSNASGIKSWIDIASSADGVHLAAAATSDYIYTSSDGGASWTQRTASGTRVWSAIDASSDASKLAATMSNGVVYTSGNSGATWTSRENSGSTLWNGIASSADGTKLAIVANGYIRTSSDSGATWTQRTSAGSRNWQAITSSADGTKLAAVVASGYIYTSTDSGATWLLNSGATVKSWKSITSSADGTKLAAVASNQYVYTYQTDTTNPSIAARTPLDDATDVSVDSDLTIEFSEVVDAESGSIVIYDASDDTAVATISVTDGQVTGTGTDTVVINPTDDLAGGTTYYIQIENTAFDDMTGNSYAGISDTTSWNFTTVATVSSGSGGGGGSSSEDIDVSCDVSDTAPAIGDEVEFDVDIDNVDDYTFSWTAVLEGDDETDTHTFDTAGKYYPRALLRTDDGNITVNCGTITVSENGDTDDQDGDTAERDNTSDTNGSIITLIKTNSTLLFELLAQGVDLPEFVRDVLKDILTEQASTTAPSSITPTLFTLNLTLGMDHPDVLRLQQFLNARGFTVALTGPGSAGNETTYFGEGTLNALIRFQNAYNITPAIGFFGPVTRAFVESL